MARIRTIKPEFWTSAQVMECSRDARLLFIGMWNFADDEGKLPLMENSIRAQIFPGDLDVDSTSIRRMIDELATNELLKIYAVAGRKYIWIPGWQHQRIDRPRPSKYPDPPIGEHSMNDRRGLAPDLILSYQGSTLSKDGEVSGAGSLAARADGALAHPQSSPDAQQGVGEKKNSRTLRVTSELERIMQAKLRRANGET